MSVDDIRALVNAPTTDQKVRVRILRYALEVDDATEPKAQSVGGPSTRRTGSAIAWHFASTAAAPRTSRQVRAICEPIMDHTYQQ